MAARRRGVAALDYVLVLGVIVTLVGLTTPLAYELFRLAYEMIAVMVSWPFM